MRMPLPLACATLAACAISAFAQDPGQGTPQANVAPRLTDDQSKAVADYWTPDRLASAVPLPVPAVDPADVIPAQPKAPEPAVRAPGGFPEILLEPSFAPSEERFPLSQGPDDNPDATAVGDGFSYEMPFDNFRTGIRNEYPYATVGKLFFTIPKGASEPAGNYVCTGAVAINNHLVVTARHCVWDYVKKVWYENWVFYPGWSNGSDAALGGAWIPHTVSTWTSGPVFSLTGGYDVAMMTMHDQTGTGCNGDKGKTIGFYTGWLGYTYGGDFSKRQWDIFGYPQEAPFEGNYQYQDEGATGVVNPFGSNDVVEVGDPQTGGASGGPWVIGFNPKDATDPKPANNTAPGYFNITNGVTSFKWTNPKQPLSMNGTVFVKGNFWNLYTYINGQACK